MGGPVPSGRAKTRALSGAHTSCGKKRGGTAGGVRHAKDPTTRMAELKADWQRVQKRLGKCRDKAGSPMPGWVVVQRRPHYAITCQSSSDGPSSPSSASVTAPSAPSKATSPVSQPHRSTPDPPDQPPQLRRCKHRPPTRLEEIRRKIRPPGIKPAFLCRLGPYVTKEELESIYQKKRVRNSHFRENAAFSLFFQEK